MMTRAKIELGRQLYFDTRLSADNTVSCASCHDPDEGFAKHTQFGVGINGQMGDRNSPVSYNRILSGAQFWDGRADSLEEQAVGPIANPIEMGNTHEACVDTVAGIPGYRLQFEKIFRRRSDDRQRRPRRSPPSSGPSSPARSPFDYYEAAAAVRAAIQAERFGRRSKDDDPELYAKYEDAQGRSRRPSDVRESPSAAARSSSPTKADCTACHVGANLTDEKYHNLGVGMDAEKPDLGRFEITKDEKDKGAFKTPTIRNVALSAPYMHDGSQKTLEEVVEWYAKGGHPNPHLSDEDQEARPHAEQDKTDLVEFMKACTGEFPKVERGRLPE